MKQVTIIKLNSPIIKTEGYEEITLPKYQLFALDKGELDVFPR